jgi:hypothetical protein
MMNRERIWIFFVVETPFYLQSYIYIQQIGVRIGFYGLGRGTIGTKRS